METRVDTALEGMKDGFGRAISYVRFSLTDRCDMRCRYCMSEKMEFLPRKDILSLEEIAELARAFVARGVRKIRLTGGEPLARRGAAGLAQNIGQLLGHGLEELTMTTNASFLREHAPALRTAGIERLNVSLDSRDASVFSHVTRRGDLDRVLDGIAAAKEAGFRIKINMVALKGLNDAEIPSMLRWCGEQGFDLSLIETMPVGLIDEDRHDRFFPLTTAKALIEAEFGLVPSVHRSGGPARYWEVPALGVRLGLISPLTQNFCESCNRIRISASGKLYMCLGHDDHVDLLAALRSGNEDVLDAAINTALRLKPKAHDFDLAEVATQRHMNMTGG